MHHWEWNIINPQAFPHCIYCCACFIFLLLTHIQVGRGPITFSSARDNVLPPTRQKPSSRLTHFLLSSMLPFPSLGAAPNAFFFLSNSSQRPWKHMETLLFCMEDSQEPLSQGIFKNKPPSPSADPDTSKTIPKHRAFKVSDYQWNTHIYIYNIMIYSSIHYIDVYVCYAKAISPYHIMSYRRFLIIQAMSKKQKDVSVWSPAFKCFMILSPTTCHWHLLRCGFASPNCRTYSRSIHTRQRASPRTKILQLLSSSILMKILITFNCVFNIHKTSIKIQKQHLTCSVSLYAHSDHCIHCFPSVCALSVMRVTPRTWHKLCNPTWVTKFPQNSREKTISHH